VPRRALERGVLRSFLSRADTFAMRGRRLSRDGTADAVATLERFAAELCGSGAAVRRAA
jgi:hypothetical protein